MEDRLHQWTKHLRGISPETLARVVAGEPVGGVVPDRDGPVFDVVVPPEGTADLW